MKKILFILFSCLAIVSNVWADEEVLWEGSPANAFDGRYNLGIPFKNAGLQVGDVLRVYLTNITESQKVWLKIDGGSVNSPDIMDVGTLYFDHTLTADNIAKIENTGGSNGNYTQGGIYLKFEKASGQVYKITVRRKGTAANRFGLYLGDPVQDNLYFTSDNNLLTFQAAEPALNDTIVMQFSGASSGDKMWLQNSSWGGSYGFPDVLSVGSDGSGEWRVVLTQQAATDFAASGCIFHRSTTDYSIGKVYLHKYVKAEDEVIPPSNEIILWQGSLSDGTVDLRYNNERVAVTNANVSEKDTIKVYVTGADAGDQVILKEAKDWDGKYTALTTGQNVVEYPMTAAYAAKIQESSFVVQRGTDNDYTVHYVTVAKYIDTPVPGYEVLVADNTYIQWDGSICTIPGSKLGNLAVGDILHIYIDKYYTSASTKDNKIEAETPADSRIGVHRNSGTYHDNIYGGAANAITSKDYTVEFTQEVYDKMVQSNGEFYDMIITGYWYSFSSVVLEHPSRFVEVTMSADGLATFSHATEAIDLSWVDGLKAYKATVSGDKIVTERVTGTVAANTGLILQGENNATYRIPFAASGTALTDNVLAPTDGSAVSGYVLGHTTAGGTAFYKVSGKIVAAGKAYIPENVTTARQLSIDLLGDETTGISTMPNSECIMHNEVYNLQGQRVSAGAKGLIIVNGKKVFNK